MRRAATLATIAKEAKVSAGTVSRILNDRTDMVISAETRRRVRQIACDLGYRPNAMAQALATGKTNMVGLWIPISHRPCYSNVIQQALVQTELSGYQAIIRQLWTSTGTPLPAESFLQGPWPDGILASDAPIHVKAIHDGGFAHPPIVGMGGSCFEGTDYVAIDFETGGLDALKHLIDAGSRRIAFLTFETESESITKQYE